MIRFPNAKINIGLHILNRRTDGFHDIETLMIPTGLTDLLEVLPSDQPGIRLSVSGIPIGDPGGGNICEAAYRVMSSGCSIGGVEAHLHKQIPTGAGLGGGSADGSFLLLMLNDLFKCGLSVGELEDMAGHLGSDCPFFIRNSTAMCSGRGEIINPMSVGLADLYLVIVIPSFRIPTAWAYQQITPDPDRTPLQELILQPIEQWQKTIVNDFEPVVFRKYPEGEKLKEELYRYGAVYAQMSGSGSAFFGIFTSTPNLSPELWRVCCYSGALVG